MESASKRQAELTAEQARIRAQIALLQSQLVEQEQEPAKVLPLSSPRHTGKRPIASSACLVPNTPSPKKRKIEKEHHAAKPPVAKLQLHRQQQRQRPQSQQVAGPGPSTMLTKLANLAATSTDADVDLQDSRSKAFSDPPATRDEDLTLIQDLTLGPADHIPPPSDPNFERLEPNSSIRLKSRIIPHEDIQSFLYGRYYLSPTQLYATVRLRPDKQGYDVPAPGDWVTIAVVAERGQVKRSRAPVTITNDDIGDKKKAKDAQTNTGGGKKYINIKLIDFGARSSSSSTTGATIRGDAFLSLLLFEAESFSTIAPTGSSKNTRKEKIYKGGSKGAFESLSKLKEGDVLVILNPTVLKPYNPAAASSSADKKPHPESNILGITPSGGPDSIIVLGRAADLGMCTVKRRDGKPCGSWTDKRSKAVGGARGEDVCEYHITNAVQKARASRPEFSAGTAGMQTGHGGSARKGESTYDPKRQWGLAPKNPTIGDGGGATYVVSGHVVNPSAKPVGETIGREGQAKAQRKREARDSEMALKMLKDRDREGMRKVMRAREVMLPPKEKGEQDEDEKEQANNSKSSGANAYSAQVIQKLGFDPTANRGLGNARADEGDVKKKLSALAAVHSSRVAPSLGPRPGRSLSSVKVPKRPATPEVEDIDMEMEKMVDLDSET